MSRGAAAWKTIHSTCATPTLKWIQVDSRPGCARNHFFGDTLATGVRESVFDTLPVQCWTLGAALGIRAVGILQSQRRPTGVPLAVGTPVSGSFLCKLLCKSVTPPPLRQSQYSLRS